ncbi:MAG TPA: dihydrolipoyl dehydrogenase [Dehalococcoidia bacterium]|nr:dihydrolipoyl dehydrogenase [Dehalococcoidia bacterium]
MADFDVVAIGGGSGGYTAAIHATQLGLSAALIERDKVGGVCLHKGCIPTKVLLETAQNLSLARRSGTFGINVDNISLDYAVLRGRQDQVVGTLHKSLRSLIQKHKVEIIEGEARLLSPTEIEVGGGRVGARHVVLATGSQPKALPGLEPDGERILTSDHCLELAGVPKSIAVIGAGSIGLEFASFFLDVGAEVTVIEALPRLLPLEDADLGRGIEKLLAARGATVLTAARVQPEATRIYDSVVELAVEQESGQQTVRAERVLVATGRGGVTDGLGLENTNVKVEKGYVQADGSYRTAEPNIFAVGDVIGGLQLAHVAAAEGYLAAEAIAGKDVEPLDYNRVPRVAYTRPHVAAVGLTEEQARERGGRVKTQRFSFRGNAMALIHDETEGFVKLVYDADSGDVLGVHILGHEGGELIAEAGLARFLNASAWEMGASVHPHPSLSEVVGEAAQLSAGISIYW